MTNKIHSKIQRDKDFSISSNYLQAHPLALQACVLAWRDYVQVTHVFILE